MLRFATCGMIVLLMAVSANGATMPAGHAFWDMDCEHADFVVGGPVPAVSGGGTTFDRPSAAPPSNRGGTEVVEDYVDPGTGATMPGKAAMLYKDASHTSSSAAYWAFGTGNGYDTEDPMTSGTVVISYDFLIPSDIVLSSNGYHKHKSQYDGGAGYVYTPELKVRYGSNYITDQGNGTPLFSGTLRGAVHTIETIVDLDAKTRTTVADGVAGPPIAMNPAYSWEAPRFHQFVLAAAVPTGEQYTAIIIDNFKVQVPVPEPSSLLLLATGGVLLTLRRRK